MSTDKLIAVQNGTGNWGYVNETGEEVIPCEYRPILHYGHTELSYPAPLSCSKMKAGSTL